VSDVKAQDFEATDFKINFSIGLIASLNKLKITFEAEQELGQKLSGFEPAMDNRNTSIDFKEVFKWIASPLLSEKLDLPPNLESLFNIHCVFLDK